MVSQGSHNAQPKDMYLKEMGLCDQQLLNVLHSIVEISTGLHKHFKIK